MSARIVALGLAALLLAGVLTAQDKATDAKKQAEMMAAYAKAATPGPQHKLLEPIVGKWTFTAKFWMDPTQPPMETQGTSERKWILGSRYIIDDVDTPSLGGEKFQGLGLMGYDNIQQKYISVWLDSMGTGMSTSLGAVDKSGKIFTYQREEFDPVSKQKMKNRDVVRIESNDKHTMEMYRILPGGKEMKSGEIIYTRK